jgi:hypothetical protein
MQVSQIMARSEQHREDVLQEATALVERVELWMPDHSHPIIAGFRRDGSASFFVGEDPVLQFNARGELRRAYDQGRLLKASAGHLVSMRRERDAEQVTLLSHELTTEETAAFCSRMLPLLIALRDSLRNGTARIARQVPAESDVSQRVLDWLNSLQEPLVIARRPNAGGSQSGHR